ncbi:MAG: hypothetical protein D6748_09420 [Calditrichaeota bacterium]|nr:MAG: hypothetical protein D6748_09420 [Calditrichota bacterium]
MDLISLRFTWFYALTQLKLKYRYTSLGFLWNFLEPAMYLLILSFVFSVVNRMNISDYAVFLFSALVPWRYFEKIVNTCMDSVVGGDWLLKKMHVSPFSFPLTRWIVATVEFLISLSVVFFIFLFLKENWTYHIFILPAIIIPWALLGLGMGLLSAVLYTFFRDVKPLIQMFLTLVFFSSPILFKPNLFDPNSLQAKLMQWHPITYFAALFQKPMYEATFPSSLDWGVALSVSLFFLLVGYIAMHRYKGRFFFYL